MDREAAKAWKRGHVAVNEFVRRERLATTPEQRLASLESARKIHESLGLLPKKPVRPCPGRLQLLALRYIERTAN